MVSAAPDPSWSTAVENADATAPISDKVSYRRIRAALLRLLGPTFARQGAYNAALLAQVVAVRDDLAGQIGDLRASIASLDERLADAFAPVRDAGPHFGAIEDTLLHHHGVIERMETVLERHERNLGDASLRFEKLHQYVETSRMLSFARGHDQIGALREELSRFYDETADLRETVRSDAETLRLLADRSGLDEPSPPNFRSDRYRAIEAAFRGSREEIIERARPYVNDIAEFRSDAPVLDLGCGRGELLEVLAEAGIAAYGLDIDPFTVESLVNQGFDARVGNGIAHLRSLPPASLRALSAIHVVEHLAPDVLLSLLDAAFRALEPGGVLLLETPNPENLIVASSTFRLDPTHREPLPPPLLALLVEEQGFTGVEVRFLVRAGETGIALPASGELVPVVEALNRNLYAARDYAVKARRP